jgi:hypothetical protein
LPSVFDSSKEITSFTEPNKNNVIEQILTIENEISPEDIEEESVSNEKETQNKFSDSNRDDNSATFDKVEIWD